MSKIKIEGQRPSMPIAVSKKLDEQKKLKAGEFSTTFQQMGTVIGDALRFGNVSGKQNTAFSG